jgi:hypothetical protein
MTFWNGVGIACRPRKLQSFPMAASSFIHPMKGAAAFLSTNIVAPGSLNILSKIAQAGEVLMGRWFCPYASARRHRVSNRRTKEREQHFYRPATEPFVPPLEAPGETRVGRSGAGYPRQNTCHCMDVDCREGIERNRPWRTVAAGSTALCRLGGRH